MVTLSALIKEAASQLQEKQIENAVHEARLLFELATGMNITKQLIEPNQIVPENQTQKFNELLEKRLQHIPFAYLSGEQEFFGRTFKVENCLIPRPETELLIEEIIKHEYKEPIGILDLCTGTGCIGITLFLELKKQYENISVTMTDISEKTIETCQKNINENIPQGHAQLIKTDLFPAKAKPYSIIVSNPPYINAADIENLQEEVQGFEPHTALDGGEDGLVFYRRIAAEIKPFLHESQTFLLMEHGQGQREAIKKIFDQADLNIKEVIEIDDLQGIDRCIGFLLTR